MKKILRELLSVRKGGNEMKKKVNHVSKTEFPRIKIDGMGGIFKKIKGKKKRVVEIFTLIF